MATRTTTNSTKPNTEASYCNKLTHLFDCLDHIDAATTPEAALDPIHEFTFGLLGIESNGDSSDPSLVTHGMTEQPQASQPPRTQRVLFRDGDEQILVDLASKGAIKVLIDTIRKLIKNDEQRVQGHGDGMNTSRNSSSPSAILASNDSSLHSITNSVFIALVNFAFRSSERATTIEQLGGLDLIMTVMDRYPFVEFLQITCIAALMVIGKALLGDVTSGGKATRGTRSILSRPPQHGYQGEFENITQLEIRMLQHILQSMEYHPGSTQLFVIACSAVGNLFGPSNSQMFDPANDDQHGLWEEDDDQEIEKAATTTEPLFQRILSCICYGLIVNPNDSVVQGVGTALLCCMIGPDRAYEMIEEAQQEHWNKRLVPLSHAAAAAA